MQTVSPLFTSRAQGQMQPLSWGVRISFDRQFSADTSFFILSSDTVAMSLLDGDDVLAPSGSTVISEWDKYRYVDYSNRLVAMEWAHEQNIPYSVNLGMADFTFNNYDGAFTPNSTVPIISHVDTTIGKTTDGAFVTGSSTDRKKVSVFTSTVEGVLKKLSVRLWLSSAGSTHIRGVVYAVSAGVPTTLLAVSEELAITNTAEQLIDLQFTGANQIDIAATDYAIGYLQQDPGTPDVNISRGGQANTSFTNTDTYSDGPSNPFGAATTESGKIDCYITVQQSIEGTLGQFILPSRPVRLLSGFGGENIPQFIGLTEGMPDIDEGNRLITFHAIGFLAAIFAKNLDEEIIQQDVTTGEVLEALFQSIGLLPGQYNLDVGSNEMSFVFFEKGTNLGDAITKLMEAEIGSLYLDELGIIQFRGRSYVSTSPVYAFDLSNIINIQGSTDDSIINSVKIKSEVRQVQEGEVIYNLAEAFVVPANSTLEKFFDYEDPVTSVSAPVFVGNSAIDGSGSDQTDEISIVSQYDFSKASKIVFENSSGSDVYIISLLINGDQARVIKNIYETYTDQASIDKYDEQLFEIQNNFIQSKNASDSVGESLLYYYGEYGSVIEADVVGTPALQINDVITVQSESFNGTYKVMSINNGLQDGGYSQRIKARIEILRNFFTLSSGTEARSLLNGPDVLAP